MAAAAPAPAPARPGAMETRLLADLTAKFIDPTRQGLYQSQAESAAVWNLYSGRIGDGSDIGTSSGTKVNAVARFLRHVNALVDPTVGGPTTFVTVPADGALPGDAAAPDVAAAVAQIRAILPAPPAAGAPAAAAAPAANSLTGLIQAAAAAAPDAAAINSRVARLNTLLNALVATFPVPNALSPLTDAPQLAMVDFIKNASAAGFHAARIASGAVTGGRRRNSLKNKRKSQKNKRRSRNSRNSRNSRKSRNSRNSRNSRRNHTR